MKQKEAIIGLVPKVAKGKIVPAVLLVALVIAGGMATYFYRKIVELQKTPQESAQTEAQEIIEKVSRLMVLPEGETPTIATVTDPERLKDQAFFSQAKKGDQVLIYTTAKKAILYDPIADKIVEVAPLNLGDETSPPSSPSNELENLESSIE